MLKTLKYSILISKCLLKGIMYITCKRLKVRNANFLVVLDLQNTQETHLNSGCKRTAIMALQKVLENDV